MKIISFRHTAEGRYDPTRIMPVQYAIDRIHRVSYYYDATRARRWTSRKRLTRLLKISRLRLVRIWCRHWDRMDNSLPAIEKHDKSHGAINYIYIT